LFEANGAGADRHAVTIGQLVFELLFAVDEDLIGAPFHLPIHEHSVDEHEGTVVRGFDVRVMT